MKRTTIMAALTLSSLIMGCSDTGAAHRAGGALGMPNPASSHCVNKGGKVLIQKDKGGNEVGICRLPDGTQVEEWELFRRDHPQPANERPGKVE